MRAEKLDLSRGTLAPGGTGDVAVFGTEFPWTYDVNQSYSRSRNSSFDGRTFHGGPLATIVNGEFIWRLGVMGFAGEKRPNQRQCREESRHCRQECLRHVGVARASACRVGAPPDRWRSLAAGVIVYN